MSATVSNKRTRKVGQQRTSRDNDGRKKKALTFSNKHHMRTHRLIQKQAIEYWQENGYQHLLPKPCLVDGIEELLAEPAAPEWVEDASELELLKMLREKDEIDNEPAGLSPQQPTLKETLKAVETLYTLTLFHYHEPEFSDIFRPLLNIRSHLTAKRRKMLKSSQITDYFQNAETDERGAADSRTDSGEVILVD